MTSDYVMSICDLSGRMLVPMLLLHPHLLDDTMHRPALILDLSLFILTSYTCQVVLSTSSYASLAGRVLQTTGTGVQVRVQRYG